VTFEITILGSSSALPTSLRHTTAHLFNMNERFFLIDCGEGAQIRMRQYHLSPAKINHIFITHLHGDHVFGLFGLISSLGLMGRKVPLNLYGPSQLQDVVESHLKFYGPLKFELNFHIADHGKTVYSDGKLEVRSLRLKHRSDTFGYIFKERPPLPNIRKEVIARYRLGVEDIKNIKEGKDFITREGQCIPNSELTLPPIKPRSYAFISDTAYLPGLVNDLKDVDLLYHEATFLDKDAALAEETMHSTARQAAVIAKDAGVGKLVIGHFSTRYKKTVLFEQEAAAVFPNVSVAKDGDKFDLPIRRQS